MTDYLANTRCVILAVLPSNVDFHNSQILADARKVDPETKRTIPVLTKPDLIDKGGETSVKDLLLGKKTESFEMGFHMIKGEMCLPFICIAQCTYLNDLRNHLQDVDKWIWITAKALRMVWQARILSLTIPSRGGV